MANNPGNLEAQQLVKQLQGQGLSNSEIARRLSVGRATPLDSSYVSQIARKGTKGAAYVPALKEMATAGKTTIATPQRTTKAGTTAKVRRGVKTVPGTDNILIDGKKVNKTIINGLHQIKGKGKAVHWRLTYKKVTVDSPGNTPRQSGIEGRVPFHRQPGTPGSGWNADKLLDRIENPQPGDNWRSGDAIGALKEISLAQNPKITSATGLVDIHFYSVD